LGDKISIVTSKPQTTRNRISGIKNYPDAQIIFLDTPGIHTPPNTLNRVIVHAARETIGDADILLMLADATSEMHPHDLLLIDFLKKAKVPVFLAINKIDLIENKYLLPLIDKFHKLYNYKEIFPISALTGEGILDLITSLKETLPEGPQLFPKDILTDTTERFIAAEFIREQIILFTKQELPYVSTVLIDSFKEDGGKNLIKISATIIVEKESQKAIMIGKNGFMLKTIGTQARIQMENFFGVKIFIKLFVRVEKNWTNSETMLREFGLLLKR
jgi:GTP-binding protein Era